MKFYKHEDEYIRDLEARGQLPRGFRVASVPLTFVPAERPQGGEQRMMLSLIRLDEPTADFAGVFTRNRFPGNPVILGKQRLEEETVRGVLINNRIANVCSDHGLEDAREILEALAQADPDPESRPESWFSSSTGIIGWGLPVREIRQAVPRALAALSGGSALPLARGIMTTDAFPKIRSVRVGEGTILAVAKGAGMIEPNMATMLCFVLTDIAVSRKDLREMLPGVADGSFNRISIDGDQSTSDMVLAFSSGQVKGVSREEFRKALSSVFLEMAEDIVRNGEGTSHVMRIRLTGAADEASARKLAKGVANSPLVKTAVAGNDPNVGRILSALGDCAGNEGIGLDPSRVTVSLGGDVLFRNHRFELDPEKEDRMAAYLRETQLTAGLKGYPEHYRTVDIDIDLGLGTAETLVFGSDLTHEYVSENAEYRT